MPWQMTMQYLINKPVGVSLTDGTSVSGVLLCSITHNEIYLMEYKECDIILLSFYGI